MKRHLPLIALLAACSNAPAGGDAATDAALAADAAADSSAPADAPASDAASAFPQWTHVGTHMLAAGTHRPEILLSDDGGFVVVAVAPGRDGMGRLVKHQAFRFDASWTPVGAPFAITWATPEYGEPADHRAALINGELYVTYQSLVWRGGSAPTNATGPLESYASEQSLMLTRYSLAGQELARTAVVPHATDFTQDSFPDHCLTVRDGALVVSTGSSGPRLRVRTVTLDGQVSATTDLTSGSAVGGVVGNSLLSDERGLWFFSGTDPNLGGSVLVAQLGAMYAPTRVGMYADPALEVNFPVGNARWGALTLVGHLGRPRGGSMDFNVSPYAPYVTAFDRSWSPVATMAVGQDGFLHVHPTVAVRGNHVYVAWSHRTPMGAGYAPQVQVDEFLIP